MVLVNFNRLDVANFCTAYHRIAKHVQEGPPPERWPPQEQRQLGGLLAEMNRVLAERAGEVGAPQIGARGRERRVSRAGAAATAAVVWSLRALLSAVIDCQELTTPPRHCHCHRCRRADAVVDVQADPRAAAAQRPAVGGAAGRAGAPHDDHNP